MNKKLKGKITTSLFVIPSLFIFINVVIIPFVMGIIYSFTNWDGFAFKGSTFVGFKNYAAVFADEKFVTSFKLTTKYTFVMIILVNIVGLSLALLVTSKVKGKNFFRGVYFLPNLIGGLILGFIWKFIFTKFFVEFGVITHTEKIFFNWLDEPTAAFWALVVVGVWQMAGYVMVIYIASIESISEDVMEAASIDGANSWTKFKKITLPLIAPAFTISLFITLSNSFKQYDTNLSLTNGGPFGSTELVTMNIFSTAFSYNKYAQAQAKSIIFFLVIMVITVIQIYTTKKREVDM
ncbi:sugar ABC transporter permease [Clostridium estertheticum]|uniref:carbohydrate ABC transporter permease n=1 Tax=Clostridium estertheticum TaxID=238834 RepID=UPI0013E9921B|nr:sugar ABC transporter permease [Clostridium estertheticum]MBZ9688599.1 sugar ABC transporter permease [Clostridium estertheticum]